MTSDENFSYLYGHCYRQFIHQVDSVGQFDAACMPHTYLARVPKGRFDLMPQYRTALGWSGNAFAATPLMTRGAANPMSVQKFGDLYVNVTKIDDWWGAWVYVDKSPNPWGPWEAAESISIVNDRKCSQCGIYHAELLPSLTADGKMVLSWSNGAPFHLWQANAFLYRPSFRAVTLPTYRTDASLGDAGMQPRTPVRALDTRQTAQRVRTGTMVKVPLAGKVAAGAVGVVANVTAVNPAYSGFLTAWPCGARMPTASVLNFQGSRNTANAVHTRLGPAQELCIMSSVDADVLVDVAGSYVPAGAAELHPLAPARIADTGGTRLAANGTLVVPVAGVGGVPTSGAQAVTVTVTASTPGGLRLPHRLAVQHAAADRVDLELRGRRHHLQHRHDATGHRGRSVRRLVGGHERHRRRGRVVGSGRAARHPGDAAATVRLTSRRRSRPRRAPPRCCSPTTCPRARPRSSPTSPR